MSDPIVDEVHRIREEMLRRHNGDLDSLMREIQANTEKLRAAGWKIVSLPPRPAKPTAPEQKQTIKAG